MAVIPANARALMAMLRTSSLRIQSVAEAEAASFARMKQVQDGAFSKAACDRKAERVSCSVATI